MNDTTVGALAITFSVLVLTMPGMSYEGMMDESTVPHGAATNGATRTDERYGRNEAWRHRHREALMPLGHRTGVADAGS